MSSLQARTLTRTAGTAASHAARLELLEHFLALHEDIVRCAQVSLDWLARHAGVRQSACLVVDAESRMLVGIAAHGTVGEQIDTERRTTWLRSALTVLNERELRIVKERRLKDEGATLEALGESLGISKERVRQIENRALEKLREALLRDHPDTASFV